MPGRSFSAGTQYRYGFNGFENDNEVKGNGNHISFGDYGYDPRINRRISSEPLQYKYPSLSPYSVFNNNPLIYKDPNGLDWTISTSIDNNGNKTVHIKLTAAVINNSLNRNLNMNDFVARSAEQIKDVYSIKYNDFIYDQTKIKSGLDNFSSKNISTTKSIEVKIVVDVDLQIINSESQLKSTQHLISIENDNDPKMSKNETAHVNEIGGKKLFVKESIASNVASGNNKQTIAHEVGHRNPKSAYLGLVYLD